MLQIDLLNGASVNMFGGEADTKLTVTGEQTAVDNGTASVLSYDMFVKLNTELNNNRCPRHTTVITGSRMIDTKVIPSARYVYTGSELKTTLLKMKDYHDNKAYIPVQHYAEAGNVAKGEIGCIDNFRIIEVPEMVYEAGAGATVTTNGGFRETDGNYDVFPLLCVGDKSFTTIGFQTGGKNVKFKVKMAMPGSTESYANDPYGETGFYSIKWFYGTMILRGEWIATMQVVAEL